MLFGRAVLPLPRATPTYVAGVIASPDGEILRIPGAPPGAMHDLTAARIWGTFQELAAAGLCTLADKGYQGAEEAMTPYKGKNKPSSSSSPCSSRTCGGTAR